MAEESYAQPLPMDKLAKVYRKIRDHIQTITKEHETEVAALKAQQDEIANAMREQMKALGVKSVRTEHGTVTMSMKTRYMSQDWDAFKTFMVENDALDLVERRISQLNMAKFLEENPDNIPPGLSSESEYAITVKKPTN
jgi:predicted transcriptional regulator